MTEDSNELLIALVRSRPVLWDKTSDKYRHVGKTKAAWAEVCRKLNEDYDSMSDLEQEMFGRDAIKKWTNLRDAMVKSLKKNRKYVYGDQLQFLARLYETDPLEEEDREFDDESKSSQNVPPEINSEQLIACMEKWPCLWDKSLPTYKDRTHNKSAWLAVVREMNPDFDQFEACDQETYRREVVKKWNNMRDTFAKSLKKGAGSGKWAKKYVHADQLHFLRRFYAAYDDVGDEEWRFQEMNEEMGVPDPPDVVLHEHTEDTVLLPSWDTQADVIPEPVQSIGTGTNEHENPPWETPSSSENPKKRKRLEHHQRQQQQQHQKSDQEQRNRFDEDEVDRRLINVLDRLEPDNRHLSFFKGILPSLDNFDEDEVLQFQMQVLRIIRDMRKRNKEKLPPNSREYTRQPPIKSEVILSDDVVEESSNSSE